MGFLDDKVQQAIVDRTVETPSGSFNPIWSNYVHAKDGANPAVWSVPSGGFALNAACWAAGLNFHGVGTWIPAEGAGGTFFIGATLISPRHVITADHLNPKLGATPGGALYFIRPDGSAYNATVASGATIAGTDLRVAYLTEDVPNDVQFHRVLPTNYDEFFTFTSADICDLAIGTPKPIWGKPVIALDQLRQAFIYGIFGSEFNLLWANFDCNYPDRGDYSKTGGIIDGDSGWPTFMLIDGELVVMGTHLTSTSISIYRGGVDNRFVSNAAVFDAINTLMNTLQGSNSDYQLTPFDLRLASIDPRNPLRKLKFPTTAPVPNNSDVDAITTAMIEMRL